MPIIKIKHCRTGAVIFSGLYKDMRACAEAAVAEGRSLNYADFRGANLAHACLDGACLLGAVFEGANLCGVNLSEALIEDVDFSGASLEGSCFAEATLSSCRFTDASFGATDIAGARLQDCIFSTLSSFSLGFTYAARIENCVFVNPDGRACGFSRPPVVVSGLEYPVILFDAHIKAGHMLRDLEYWLDTPNDNLPPDAEERALCGFLQRYREAILFLGAARLPFYREAAPVFKEELLRISGT
jgi:hypothetical protein